ncbi:MAG: tetratricopeptide repeat protein [Aureliella sp.]
MGVRLYQQGRYAEALQQFQVAQSADPSNPDAYYNLASTYHRLGVSQKDAKMIEQSESLYNQCLDLSPDHVDCHRGLAVLLVESNRRDSALRLLSNWSARSPQLSDPLVELARINQELGKTELAGRYLEDAIAANPADARAWSARAQLHEAAGDFNKAMQDYQQSLAINSLQPQVIQRVASLTGRMSIGPQNSQWTASNPQVGGQQRY